MSQPAIDVHAHHVPADFLRRAREAAMRKAFPHVQVEEVAGGSVRFKMGGEPWTRPVMSDLTTIEARTQRLATRTIVAQLNGGWPDVFGYSLPPEEGAVWSAFLNNSLRESLAAASNADVVYLPLATVPLQDGLLAAEELARAAKSGHAGAMIGTWIPAANGARDLDDPGLEPFWARAEELALPIFVHPVFAGGSGDVRITDLGLANAVARPNRTALAMSRLLYAGVLERHPGLKLVVAHGGGALPTIMGRLERNFELLRAAGETGCRSERGLREVVLRFGRLLAANAAHAARGRAPGRRDARLRRSVSDRRSPSAGRHRSARTQSQCKRHPRVVVRERVCRVRRPARMLRGSASRA